MNMMIMQQNGIKNMEIQRIRKRKIKMKNLRKELKEPNISKDNLLHNKDKVDKAKYKNDRQIIINNNNLFNINNNFS